jgi:hypothetical protein
MLGKRNCGLYYYYILLNFYVNYSHMLVLNAAKPLIVPVHISHSISYMCCGGIKAAAAAAVAAGTKVLCC